MSSTLIDGVRSVFTEDLILKFSGLLGETEINTGKAIHGAIPMALTAALQRGFNPTETQRLWNISRQATGSDFFGHLHELGAGAGGLVVGNILLNKGTDCARELFGDRTQIVTAEISRYSGVTTGSAAFLTGVVSFAVLDAIGRQLTNNKTEPGATAPWLATQRDSISGAIPAGLQVRSALGIDHYPGEKKTKARGNAALYVFLVLIIIGIAAFVVYRSWDKIHPATVSTAMLFIKGYRLLT